MRSLLSTKTDQSQSSLKLQSEVLHHDARDTLRGESRDLDARAAPPKRKTGLI